MEEVKMALQLEKDGYAYYKKAAELCHNQYGKRMFDKLAADEIAHLQKFKKIAEGIYGEVDEGEGPRLDIFEQIDFSTRAGEYMAIDHAIAFEERAYEYFRNAAEKARDERARKLFAEIAEEEKTHLALLEAESSYLHKSGIWFDHQEFHMDGL